MSSFLLSGCPKSHRAGGCHGETENEGGFETGEQHVVGESEFSRVSEGSRSVMATSFTSGCFIYGQ